jgi:hypothetical protein
MRFPLLHDSSGWWRLARLAALLLGLTLLIIGFWQHHLLAQLPWARTRDALQFATAASLLAGFGKWWLRLDFGHALVLVLAIAHALLVGLAPMLATGVLAAVALVLGDLLWPARTLRDLAIAMTIGLGLVAAAIGWTLGWRIHYSGVYAMLALLLLLWRRHALTRACAPLAQLLRQPWQIGWEGWLALCVVAYSATSAWLPTVQFDDLVFHLGLPSQLAQNGYYRLDALSEAWALAPWAGDALQAVAQMLAGVEARGAVDTLWLLLGVVLIWQLLAGLDVAVRWRWLGVALFASQPMTHTLLQSMQTELPSAAVLLAIAALLLDRTPVASAARMLALACLFGFALGLKLTMLAFVGPLGLWTLWRLRPLPWRVLPAALLLAFVVGGSSYVQAALLTGNPVLPLFNDVFHAVEFGPERLLDMRFQGLLTWRAPYELVMDSGRFSESLDGAGGFQWLALLFTLLLAARGAQARALLLVGLAGCVLMYSQVQYLRYLFPGLALLSLPLAIGLANTGRWTRWLAALLVALNVAAMSNSIWTVRDPPLAVRARVATVGTDAWLRTVMPERLLLRHLRATAGTNYSVLLLTEVAPYAAEAGGRGFSNSWYAPDLQARAKLASADASGEAYAQWFDELGLTHVSIRSASESSAVLAALAAHATVERREGEAALYRLRRAPAALRGLPPVDAAAANAPLAIDVLSPLRAAVAIEVAAHLRCEPAAGAIAVHMEAGGVVIGSDFQLCRSDGQVDLEFSARAASAQTLKLWFAAGPQVVYAIDEIEARVRNDLPAQRDRAR